MGTKERIQPTELRTAGSGQLDQIDSRVWNKGDGTRALRFTLRLRLLAFDCN